MANLDLIRLAAPDGWETIEVGVDPYLTSPVYVGNTVATYLGNGNYVSTQTDFTYTTTYFLDGVEVASNYTLLAGDVGKILSARQVAVNPPGGTVTVDTLGEEVTVAANSAPAGANKTLTYTVPPPAASAPTLSSPTGAKNGAAAYTGTVATDTTSGTLYWTVTTSATPPSAATIKADQSAIVSASPVSVSGVGLSASTTYYIHYVQNASGLDSNVVSSTSFTTDAASGISFIGSNTIYLTSANGTSYSPPSYTVTSGANKLVVIAVSGGKNGASGTPTLTVTFGGASDDGNYQGSTSNTTNRRFTSLHYFKAPSAGSKAISVTSTSSLRSLAVSVLEFDGVDQTTPVPTHASGVSSSNGGSRAQSITTANANAYIVWACTLDDGNKTITTTGDITNPSGHDNAQTGTLTGDQRVSHGYHAAGATGSYTATWTFSASDGWASEAIELKPA